MTGHQLEQTAHSPIGASSCERWWNCPGSVALIASLPPFEGTPSTAKGTVAHYLGEQQLRGYIEACRSQNLTQVMASCTLDDEIGRSYVEDGFEIDVDESMVEAVRVYLTAVLDYILEYGLDLTQDLRVEVKFDLTHIDPEAFGTCDAVIVVPMNRIIVIDYKHGYNVVEVESNHQLQYYALGAYYGLPDDERADLGYVEMVIVQPNARHLDGQIRRHVYRISDLLAFEKELAQAIARVRLGDPALLVGNHCKFCNGKPICPATQLAMSNAAGLSFDRIYDERLSLPDARALTPERLSTLIQNADLLQSWVKSVWALGTSFADNGTAIPGYKLVVKHGNRRWKNEKEVEKAFALDFEDKIYNKKLKSPAQLEKVVGKKRHEELEPYWEIPVTGRTLVSENDGRDGVESGPLAAFSEDFL